MPVCLWQRIPSKYAVTSAATREYHRAGKLFNIDNTRFFTYAGLVVATCIILHKNWIVASGVGVVVAAYISFTEYYLANNDIRNAVHK